MNPFAQRPMWIPTLIAAFVLMNACTHHQTRTDNKPPPVFGVPPDLMVKSVTCPGTGTRGQFVSVSDVVTNKASLGDGTTMTYLHVLMNTNQTLVGATNVWVHTVGILKHKTGESNSGSFTVPSNRPIGQNFIIFYADFPNDEPESYETNNTNSCSITIN